MRQAITIGTRGSLLARAQAAWVVTRLATAHPHVEVSTVVIQTAGDRMHDAPSNETDTKGLFTRAIETALLEGRIDLAVHSMKDLPTQLPEGLVVAAVPTREDPRDALVASKGTRLGALPPGARLGTSSPRRAAQLRAYRPDVNVVALRGNIDTRIRRVFDGELDGAVLACAGLNRLERADAIAEIIPLDIMMPAVGQGALALEIREGYADMRATLVPLHSPSAAAETTAERALLRALGGGCRVPVGALARADNDRLVLRACVCSLDGACIIRAALEGPVTQPEELGRKTAATLVERGADDLLDAAI